MTACVGAVLGMARGGYSTTGLVGMIAAFNALKFLCVEPIVSYAVSPAATAGRVKRFSAWMDVHKADIIAAVVAVIGLALWGRSRT